MSKLTNEQVNRLITENLFGECWHEWFDKFESRDLKGIQNRQYVSYPFHYICVCGHRHSTLWDRKWNPPNSSHIKRNTDFFTWEGFGRLWEKLQEQEWLNDYLAISESYQMLYLDKMLRVLINPHNLAHTVAEYGVKKLGWK